MTMPKQKKKPLKRSTTSKQISSKKSTGLFQRNRESRRRSRNYAMNWKPSAKKLTTGTRKSVKNGQKNCWSCEENWKKPRRQVWQRRMNLPVVGLEKNTMNV